jgi:hypothetical protein
MTVRETLSVAPMGNYLFSKKKHGLKTGINSNRSFVDMNVRIAAAVPTSINAAEKEKKAVTVAFRSIENRRSTKKHSAKRCKPKKEKGRCDKEGMM